MTLFDLPPAKGMRALTWKEPYASLMLYGKIETRTWKTTYRGRVLICASKKEYKIDDWCEISGDTQFKRILELVGGFLGLLYLKNTNGYAIATGDLVDCRPMREQDEDRCFVKFRESLWCHVYENVQPINPFPWKGSQGWRQVPDEIIQSIVYK